MVVSMSLTIKAKVWLFVLVIMLLMLVAGFYTISKMQDVAVELDELAELNVPLVGHLSRIGTKQEEQTVYLQRYFRLLDDKDIRIFIALGEEVSKEFSMAHQLLAKREKRDDQYSEVIAGYLSKLDTLGSHHESFERHAESLLAHISGSKLALIPELEEKLRRKAENINLGLAKLLLGIEADAQQVAAVEHIDNAKLLNQVYLPLIRAVTDISQKQLAQEIGLEKFFRSPDGDSASEFSKLSKHIDSAFVETGFQLQKHLSTELSQQLEEDVAAYLARLKQLDAAHGEFETSGFQLIEEIQKSGLKEIAGQEQALENEAFELDEALNSFLFEVEKQTEQLAVSAEQHEKSAITVSFIIYAIALLVAAVAGALLARNIVSALSGLAQATDRLVEGDLSSEIAITSKDEIGELSKKFVEMQGSFSQMATNAKLFAAGDYQQLIEPRTDRDEFGLALSHMMKQVNDRNRQIKEAEARTKAIIDTAVDGIFTITELGLVETLNPAAEKLFQYSAHEVVGKNVKLLMPSPYKDEHDSYLANYRNSGIRKIIGKGREVTGRRKDGTTFPIFLSVGEILVSGQRLFTGIVRDITEQKDSERKLIDRSEQMEQQNWLKSQIARVLAISSSGQTTLDLAQSVISELAGIFSIGHGAFYMLEKSPQGSEQFVLLGSYAYQERKNVSNHFAHGEGLVGQAALEQKTIHLTRVPDDYIKITSGLGEKAPLNLVAQPVILEDKTLAVIELASFTQFEPVQLELLQQICKSLAMVINNVVGKQRIELLLAESQRQGQQLQSQQEELKASNEELQSQQEELKASNEELQSQTEALKESQNQLEQQKDSLKTSNQELEQRQGEIRQQNQQLELSRAELEKKGKALELSSKYKSEFLANMSHELRTPLNSLLILSKSLADNKQGNLNEKQVKSANVIYEGGVSLLEMINDILDLSKVEAGRLEVEVLNVKLEDVCQGLYSMFEQQAVDKGLEFSVDVVAGAVEIIRTDGHRLEQILRNFLSNAFKFTETGSVTIQIHGGKADTVFIKPGFQPGNVVGLSVQDTGTGISEDKTDLIFEAFQQQDGSISRKYGGTGLGLTISRELARLLRGEIQVVSELGKGSCFTLYLPLDFEPQGASGSEEKVPVPSPPVEITEKAPSAIEPVEATNNGKGNIRLSIAPEQNYILVVEDDPNFANELERIVKESNFSCMRSSTGREALYLAMEHKPQGILLDIGLPDIDGFEVIEQLKANPSTRNIPVHVLSGADHKSDALSHGVYGFSMKPVGEEDVKTALISLNARRPMKKLLVVEDDSGERMAIDVLLHDEDTQVEYACDGKQVGELLTDDHDFDCVILDLGLPDMSGMEVLENIRKLPRKERLPVIIYTGRELSEELQAKLHSYADDIIIKGAESPERLMDDISLFVHSVDKNSHMEPHHDHSLLDGRRILLVDDDIRNTYALSSQLEQEKMNVEIADNGKRAVDILIDDHGFELILMDIMMPEMDGFEAMGLIRQMAAYKDTPIIALTAKAMPEDRAACIRAGASEYLAKPINMDRLLSMLKVWLYKAS